MSWSCISDPGCRASIFLSCRNSFSFYLMRFYLASTSSVFAMSRLNIKIATFGGSGSWESFRSCPGPSLLISSTCVRSWGTRVRPGGLWPWRSGWATTSPWNWSRPWALQCSWFVPQCWWTSSSCWQARTWTSWIVSPSLCSRCRPWSGWSWRVLFSRIALPAPGSSWSVGCPGCPFRCEPCRSPSVV